MIDRLTGTLTTSILMIMRHVILVVLLIIFCGSCLPVRPVPSLSADVGSFHWSRTPVLVYVDESIPEVVKDGVREAVLEWNYVLGRPQFAYHEVPEYSGALVFAPRGVVTVSMGELGSVLEDVSSFDQEPLSNFRVRNILGVADLSWSLTTGRAYSCMVLLDYEVDALTAKPVAVHELGHCLGLKHTSNPDSIMYISAVESPSQRILESDVSLILRAMP